MNAFGELIKDKAIEDIMQKLQNLFPKFMGIQLEIKFKQLETKQEEELPSVTAPPDIT